MLNPLHQLAQSFLPRVGINLRGGDALMAQQGLDVDQLGVVLQEPGSVGMPQLVRGDGFLDAGLLDQLAEVIPDRPGGHGLAAG